MQAHLRRELDIVKRKMNAATFEACRSKADELIADNGFESLARKPNVTAGTPRLQFEMRALVRTGTMFFNVHFSGPEGEVREFKLSPETVDAMNHLMNRGPHVYNATLYFALLKVCV